MPNPQPRARGGGERESGSRRSLIEEGVGRTGKKESRGKGQTEGGKIRVGAVKKKRNGKVVG